MRGAPAGPDERVSGHWPFRWPWEVVDGVLLVAGPCYGVTFDGIMLGSRGAEVIDCAFLGTRKSLRELIAGVGVVERCYFEVTLGDGYCADGRGASA